MASSTLTSWWVKMAINHWHWKSTSFTAPRVMYISKNTILNWAAHNYQHFHKYAKHTFCWSIPPFQKVYTATCLNPQFIYRESDKFRLRCCKWDQVLTPLKLIFGLKHCIYSGETTSLQWPALHCTNVSCWRQILLNIAFIIHNHFLILEI